MIKAKSFGTLMHDGILFNGDPGAMSLRMHAQLTLL